jgi:hypothetical protein
MDADDRLLFTESLRQLTGQHTGKALDDALTGLGWHDALQDETRDAVGLLFELQGSANATSAALDDVLARTLGVASGAAVILPPVGKSSPLARVAGHPLQVQGIASHAIHDRGRAVIAFDQNGTHLAEVAADRLEHRPVKGIDPDLGLVEVTGELALTELSVSPASHSWQAAIAAGQIALAHELVGASQHMLELARTHALEREQFGRPIAGFQAIRHRLADAYVAVEGMRAGVTAGWDDETPMAAAIAKAVAGAGAAAVRKQAQQVLGGMGYTTEHSLHRYVRRTLVLDQLLGAGRTLTRELGHRLLTARDVPALLPL